VFTVRYRLHVCIYYLEDFKPSHSSPSIRLLLAVLSPRTPKLDPGTFKVEFVTGRSVTVASFFSQSTAVFLCEDHINITLIIRTSGRNVGTFKHNGALSDMGVGGGLSDVRVSRGEACIVAVLCWLQGVKSDTEGA